jgi:hypothetical protein
MTTQLQYGMEGDRPYGLYYEHSGRTPLPSVLLAGLAGIVAALAAGIAYAYVIEFVPYIKLRGLAACGFGALAGFVTARIAKAGKVRSLSVGLAIVGVATLAGYYACWLVWIKNLLGKAPITYGDLIIHPGILLTIISNIVSEGVWRMSEHDTENVKGTFLVLIWIAEAAAIFGMAFLAAAQVLRGEMFCETCNRWCGRPATLRRVAIGDPIRLKQSLEAHDFSYLDSLPPSAAEKHWEVAHDYCSSCNRLHALTIKQHAITRNKKGRVTAQKHTTLVNRLIIEGGEAQALRSGPRQAAPQ